jgi:hypothetical protein
VLDTTDCRTREDGLNKGYTMNENITKLNNELELSNEHASDVALLGTCRKCEQNDPTYRYDDCPVDDIETKTLAALTIIVREWFDKTYGNTYYSAAIFANGERVYTFPMSYGHGEYTVLERANGVLRDLGYELPTFTPSKYKNTPYHYEYREAGVQLIIETTTVTRQKDMYK